MRATVCLVVGLVAGCPKNESTKQPRPTFTTTSVACVSNVGTPTRGPSACKAALKQFLETKSTARIASIFPLETRVLDGERGTQELIVSYADHGPWPAGGDLRVDDRLCGTGGRTDPKQCLSLVEQLYSLDSAADIEFLVPLTRPGESTDRFEPGTSEFLLVTRKLKM